MSKPFFTPSLPQVLLLVSVLLAGPAQAESVASQLPDIGDAGFSVLSPHEEKQLGREFMRSIRSSLDLLDDPQATAYLQSLADKLLSQVNDATQEITIFVVNDPSINAFAGPGGYIGIHTGLILASHSEAELASVVAHEIAHVEQRHLVRAFEAGSRMSLPTMGAIIAAIMLGAKSPQVSEAVLASAIAGSAQQQLSYSRAHEQEADRVGLDLLVHAGYNPKSMVDFFEKLQEKQRFAGGAAAPEFLRTHPLTLSRVADVRNRAAQYTPPATEDNTTFQLFQARIAVYAKNIEEFVPFRHVKNNEQLEARRYYRALSAAKKERYAEARTLLQELLRADRNRVMFYADAAQLELDSQNFSQAQKILTEALNTFPANTLLVELYAKTLLQQNKIQQAFNMLKTSLRLSPKQYRLYPLYARAAAKYGRQDEAYRALAELQYALGSLHQAVSYLEQAIAQTAAASYERLTLNARLHTLKQQLLEQSKSDEQASGHGEFLPRAHLMSY